MKRDLAVLEAMERKRRRLSEDQRAAMLRDLLVLAILKWRCER